MKEFLEYIGLIFLFLFSFYYTDKVTNIALGKDKIMESIEEVSKELNPNCIEGLNTTSGVILGISGLEIDKISSYSNMRGLGFNKESLVYKENKCEINKETSLNKFIVGGNSNKNSISLIFKVNTGKYLEEIVSISEREGIKLSFIVNGINVEEYSEYYQILYNSGYDILYSGRSKKDLEVFLDNFSNETYCCDSSFMNVIEECSKKNINSLKFNKIYEKDAFLNIKNTIKSGDFIVLSENEINKEELSSIINFIRAKGFNLISISEHLKDY